jgi:hypothetical protein
MNRIPKVIHYCWLSGEEPPQRVKDCIESWKTILPDYELRLWDMDSFDVESVPWVKQAVQRRKWAFAADYIRLYALYHHGGIYLDSDIRMIKSLDPYLAHRGFSCIEWDEKVYLNPGLVNFESNGINIEMAFMGVEKGHPLIRDFMAYYEDRDFIFEDGEMDMRPMPFVMTPIAQKHGFDNSTYWNHQVLEGDFHIYPNEMCPGRTHTFFDEPVFNHNTVAFHLHHTSWRDSREGYRRLHSPYTEFRRHFLNFCKYVSEDVFCRRDILIYNDRKYRKKREW